MDDFESERGDNNTDQVPGDPVGGQQGVNGPIGSHIPMRPVFSVFMK